MCGSVEKIVNGLLIFPQFTIRVCNSWTSTDNLAHVRSIHPKAGTKQPLVYIASRLFKGQPLL